MNRNIIKKIFDEELDKIITRKVVENIVRDELQNVNESLMLEKRGKSKKKKSTKKDKVFVKQVQSMLKDDKIDAAAVARDVYPNTDEDTRRSYICKQKNGKRPISHKQATAMYNSMNSRHKNRKKAS